MTPRAYLVGAAALLLSGCAPSLPGATSPGIPTLTPAQIDAGCGYAKAGAAVGRAVAKGGAVATQDAIGEVTNDVCMALTGH